MGTTDRIAEALFGQTRRQLLALFFGRPSRSYYVREIERETGAGIGAIQRELQRLLGAGLITRTEVGSQVHYAANVQSPVYPELHALLTKTAGIADVIRRALKPLARNGAIEVALVYGSVAAGKATAASDIDLMVVGHIMLGQLMPAIRRIQNELGREVNPTVYDRYEFLDNASLGNGLVARMLKKPRIMVIGTDDELERLAGKPLD